MYTYAYNRSHSFCLHKEGYLCEEGYKDYLRNIHMQSECDLHNTENISSWYIDAHYLFVTIYSEIADPNVMEHL